MGGGRCHPVEGWESQKFYEHPKKASLGGGLKRPGVRGCSISRLNWGLFFLTGYMPMVGPVQHPPPRPPSEQ